MGNLPVKEVVESTALKLLSSVHSGSFRGSCAKDQRAFELQLSDRAAAASEASEIPLRIEDKHSQLEAEISNQLSGQQGCKLCWAGSRVACNRVVIESYTLTLVCPTSTMRP